MNKNPIWKIICGMTNVYLSKAGKKQALFQLNLGVQHIIARHGLGCLGLLQFRPDTAQESPAQQSLQVTMANIKIHDMGGHLDKSSCTMGWYHGQS